MLVPGILLSYQVINTVISKLASCDLPEALFQLYSFKQTVPVPCCFHYRDWDVIHLGLEPVWPARTWPYCQLWPAHSGQVLQRQRTVSEEGAVWLVEYSGAGWAFWSGVLAKQPLSWSGVSPDCVDYFVASSCIVGWQRWWQWQWWLAVMSETSIICLSISMELSSICNSPLMVDLVFLSHHHRGQACLLLSSDTNHKDCRDQGFSQHVWLSDNKKGKIFCVPSLFSNKSPDSCIGFLWTNLLTYFVSARNCQCSTRGNARLVSGVSSRQESTLGFSPLYRQLSETVQLCRKCLYGVYDRAVHVPPWLCFDLLVLAHVPPWLCLDYHFVRKI